MGSAFINVCDVTRFANMYKDELTEIYSKVLESGQYIGGSGNRWVEALESNLSEYLGGSVYTTTCNSGTTALLMSLMAIGITPGSEVILPDFTFIAAAEVVTLLGCVPVFADIDKRTCLMTAAYVKERITKKTRAIIMTDMFGQFANVEALQKLALENEIYLIEDAAQSFGAVHNGIKAGTFGDIAITSFYPTKPLGGIGEGGAVFTKSKLLRDALRRIRDHGQNDKYTHTLTGLNGRMNGLQAAVLNYRLTEKFDYELGKRSGIAKKYMKRLPDNVLPYQVNDYPTWAQFTLQVPNRADFIKKLSLAKVGTAIHYPKPLSEQAVYKEIYHKLNKFSPYNLNTEDVCDKIVSIPAHPFLTDIEVSRVCKAVNEALV